MDFNSLVDNFDTDKRKQQAKKVADRILTYGVSKDAAVLDYGCGTGLTGLELIDYVGSVTFADSSDGMIERVKEKIADIPNTEAVLCDLEKDPHSLDGRSFDLIYTVNTLHHVGDIEALLRAFYSLLNPEGRVILIDLDKNEVSFHSEHLDFKGHDGLDRDELGALLGRIGYLSVEADTYLNGEKMRDGEMIKFSQFILSARK